LSTKSSPTGPRAPSSRRKPGPSRWWAWPSLTGRLTRSRSSATPPASTASSPLVRAAATRGERQLWLRRDRLSLRRIGHVW